MQYIWAAAFRVSKIDAAPPSTPPLAAREAFLWFRAFWNPGELLCSQDPWFLFLLSALGFLTGFWSVAFDEGCLGVGVCD